MNFHFWDPYDFIRRCAYPIGFFQGFAMAAILHSLALALICCLIFSEMIAMAASSRAVPLLSLDAASSIDFSYRLKVVPNREDDYSSPPPHTANGSRHWKRETPGAPPLSPPEQPPASTTSPPPLPLLP